MRTIPEKETLTVEFKSDCSGYSDTDLVDEIVGMANTQGGDLYLGVEDNGEITGFDSTGYLMNHTKRQENGKYKYTPESATKLLNSSLKVKGSKKVFIPTDFGTEIFAYEYHCVAPDNQEILVYIDPKTGTEAEILILLTSCSRFTV